MSKFIIRVNPEELEKDQSIKDYIFYKIMQIEPRIVPGDKLVKDFTQVENKLLNAFIEKNVVLDLSSIKHASEEDLKFINLHKNNTDIFYNSEHLIIKTKNSIDENDVIPLAKDITNSYFTKKNTVEYISQTCWVYDQIKEKLNKDKTIDKVHKTKLENYFQDLKTKTFKYPKVNVNTFSNIGELYIQTNQYMLEDIGCKILLYKLGENLFSRLMGNLYEKGFKDKQGSKYEIIENKFKKIENKILNKKNKPSKIQVLIKKSHNNIQDPEENYIVKNINTKNPLSDDEVNKICEQLKSELLINDLYQESRLLKNIQFELDLMITESQGNDLNYLNHLKNRCQIAQIYCLFYIDKCIDSIKKRFSTTEEEITKLSKIQEKVNKSLHSLQEQISQKIKNTEVNINTKESDDYKNESSSTKETRTLKGKKPLQY